VAAALASLQAEREAREAAERAAAEEHLRAARAGTPPPGRGPAGARVQAARIRLEKEKAAAQARVDDWERRKAAGQSVRRRPAGPDQACGVRRAAAGLDKALARQAARAAASAENKKAPAVRNVTDPDSRLMPVRGGGFIQGYNAQNVPARDGLIIATRLTDDTTDYGWYQPMTGAAAAAAGMMAAAGAPGDGTIGLVLADAGYLSEHNLTCAGPDRLIATGKHRDLEKQARAGGQQDTPAQAGTAAAAMTARLAAPEAITAYRQRGPIAETPHGRIKHNMAFRRLSVRGMPKAAAEWTFACAVHNLMLAITSGHLTTWALATLTG
jgi:hypothetical protein